MKITYKIAAAALMLGFAVQANAQDSATGTATVNATVITPLTISATGGTIEFGNIISKAGTVTVNPDGTITDAASLTSNTGAATSAASFAVSGEDDYNFSVTLPDTYILTRASGTETITIDNFAHDLGATPVLSASGTATLNVGASLTLDGTEVGGVYSNATPFEVTVAYQ